MIIWIVYRHGVTYLYNNIKANNIGLCQQIKLIFFYFFYSPAGCSSAHCDCSASSFAVYWLLNTLNSLKYKTFIFILFSVLINNIQHLSKNVSWCILISCMLYLNNFSLDIYIEVPNFFVSVPRHFYYIRQT